MGAHGYQGIHLLFDPNTGKTIATSLFKDRNALRLSPKRNSETNIKSRKGSINQTD
jgi:hypothetical protein